MKQLLEKLNSYLTDDVYYFILFICLILFIGTLYDYLYNKYIKCNNTCDCPKCTDEEIKSCINLNQTEEFPPLKYYYDLFSKDECNEIIEYARPLMAKSLVDKGFGDYEESNIRTSTTAWIHYSELPSLTRVSKLVAQETGLPVENQEDWQVVHYLPGQEYRPHYDAINPYGSYNEQKGILDVNKKNGIGHRLFTFFIYLNDVKRGGETWFPRIKQGITPKAGKGVLWENMSKNRKEVHLLSEHGGNPVIEGEKWAINVWIRENKFIKD